MPIRKLHQYPQQAHHFRAYLVQLRQYPMTTSTRRLTATAENGQVFTRSSRRTYTHAVYVETTYSDGEVVNSQPRWAGRPDLAEKSLAQLAQHAARKEGEEVLLWDMRKGAWIHTGRFYAKARAIAVPVSG